MKRSVNGFFGEGFTLVELLIAVAILGILAAIAVPQLNNAIIRAQTAKAVGDMAALEKALWAFANGNHDMFPMVRNDFYKGDSGGEALPRLERLAPLTTPVAYIGGIPTDPFAAGDDERAAPPNDVYAYWDEETTKKFRDANAFMNVAVLRERFGTYKRKANQEGLLLISHGPDRFLPVNAAKLPPSAASPSAAPVDAHACAPEYDPSNGIASAGEIYRPVVIGKDH